MNNKERLEWSRKRALSVMPNNEELSYCCSGCLIGAILMGLTLIGSVLVMMKGL